MKNKSKGKVAVTAATPVSSATKHKAKSTTPVAIATKHKAKAKHLEFDVAVTATTPVSSATKYKAKLTTPVAIATKHKAKAKHLEFDVDAVSFGIDETKASYVINFSKVKAKPDVLEAQVGAEEPFLNNVDVIVSSVEIDATAAADIIDTKVDVDTASVKDEASRAADAIDMQVHVETVTAQEDESLAADTIHAEVELVTASLQIDDTGEADIIGTKVDVDTASIEDEASRAADAIDAQVHVETVTAQKDESIIDAQVDVETASIVNSENREADVIRPFKLFGNEDEFETIDVEEQSFEQTAADAILKMSDDTDALPERDVVDLMLSSQDNLPLLDDIMFVYPFVGGGGGAGHRKCRQRVILISRQLLYTNYADASSGTGMSAQKDFCCSHETGSSKPT